MKDYSEIYRYGTPVGEGVDLLINQAEAYSENEYGRLQQVHELEGDERVAFDVGRSVVLHLEQIGANEKKREQPWWNAIYTLRMIQAEFGAEIMTNQAVHGSFINGLNAGLDALGIPSRVDVVAESEFTPWMWMQVTRYNIRRAGENKVEELFAGGELASLLKSLNRHTKPEVDFPEIVRTNLQCIAAVREFMHGYSHPISRNLFVKGFWDQIGNQLRVTFLKLSGIYYAEGRAR